MKKSKEKLNTLRQQKYIQENLWDTAKAVLRGKFTGLPQETIKIPYEQSNSVPKGTRKRTNTT